MLFSTLYHIFTIMKNIFIKVLTIKKKKKGTIEYRCRDDGEGEVKR
ncbi:MAG: hypothetical protein Ta2D_02680 [Rickettsiales bacterium]|nr:MAG: hypothetical protein Ta2D_02680 [Rickettsiales bacterium]